MPKPLRIFFVLNESGCSFWRGRLPASHIAHQGLAEVQVYNLASVSRDELEPIFAWTNLVVTQTPAGTDAVCVLSMYQRLGKKLVCDYDDLIFASHPFNPAYRNLGLKEVKVRDMTSGQERWLWKDGKEGFSLIDNRVRFLSLQDLLHMSDGITVTTDYLCEQYKKILTESSDPRTTNGWEHKIHKLPNAVDFDVWKPLEKRVRDHRRLRIGWVCSSSHLSELWMVEDIIKAVHEKYGDRIVFVILGDVRELARCPRLPKSSVEFHDWTDLSMYPLKLASLELDLAMCPLQDNAFNRSKSQLKWTEFSAFHIPSVVSKSPPYDCVRHGEDGLVAYADNEVRSKEWLDCLGQLIENPEQRRTLGEAAFQRNFEEFNMARNVRTWVKTYEQVMS